MKIIKCEQGSKEWHDARRCRVTGRKLKDVMGTPLARVQLIAELIAEEATEQSKAFKTTAIMDRGTEEEPFAIKAFEEKTGWIGDKSIGLCVSDEFDWFGVSPDLYIKDANGIYTKGIEVKNPETSTNMFYRLTNEVGMEELGLGSWSKVTEKNPVSVFAPSSKAPFLGVPDEYKWQIVCSFLVNTDLQKKYFVVYDARIIDPEQKLYIVEIERNNPELQEAMKDARTELIKFRADWMKWKEIILPTKF